MSKLFYSIRFPKTKATHQHERVNLHPHVLFDPISEDESDSSGRPVVFGCTPSGRYICVVYEMFDDVTIYPITAFEIED